MPNPTRLPLALALLCGLGTAPAMADVRVGSWQVGPNEGVMPARCIAANASDPEGAVLLAMVADLGVIKFAMTSPRFALTEGQTVEAEVLIDGRAIVLDGAYVFDASSLLIEAKAKGRDEGSLLRGLERGTKVVVQAAGVRSTFDLVDTGKATDALSRCDMDADQMEATSQVTGDQPGDGEAAKGISSPPAGLEGAMRSLTGRAPPMAQFHCEFSGTDLLGLPDTDGRGGTKSVLVTIATDGSALINGTVLDPLKTDTGGNDPASAGALVSAVYSARQVIAALESATGDRAPVAGLTPKQMEAYKMFRKLGSGMIDEAMGGRDRFMLVGLAIDSIAFFDLDGAQQAVNATTPVCIRSM